MYVFCMCIMHTHAQEKGRAKKYKEYVPSWTF